VIRATNFKRTLAAACLMAACTVWASGQVTAVQDQVTKQATADTVVGQLTVTVGRSLSLNSALAVKRLAFADGSVVDAQATGPKEVLISGKTPGETSLIVWLEDGTRLIYDVTVRVNPRSKVAKTPEVAK
jgi:Flp pilus assembly secretin CpaC